VERGRARALGSSGQVASFSHRAQPVRGEGLQLAQGLVLNLADALARDVECAADLVDRARMLAVESVAQLEHAPLAVGEVLGGGLNDALSIRGRDRDGLTAKRWIRNDTLVF
jgi:hypothetical protein